MKRPPLTEEQASVLTKQEYEHLQVTYSTLVKSFTLSDSNNLKLVTAEGDEFKLHVTSEGWRVTEGGTVNQRERTWEMVEDLLRSISPYFKEGWDMMLLQKLEALAESQGHSEEEELAKIS